jgi:hypothetical protein
MAGERAEQHAAGIDHELASADGWGRHGATS